jgi:hypothetical protein
MIGRWADSTQWAVELASRLSPTRPSDNRTYVSDGWIRVTRTVALGYRGRLDEAFKVVTTSGPLGLVADLALLGGVPADSAATAIRAGAPRNPLSTHPFLPWLAAVGDTATISRYGRMVDSLLRAPNAPIQRSRLRLVSTLAQGYLALARRDTALALRRFEAVPDTACISCLADRLTKARLFASQGRDREAEALLGVRLNRNPTMLEPLFALERGRVSERLGEHAAAVEAYGFVVRVWRNADPVLQPLVEEARAALARLSREPGS